jgi:hypothetical protein
MGLFIKANLATIGYRVRTYGKQKGKFISDRRRKQTTVAEIVVSGLIPLCCIAF